MAFDPEYNAALNERLSFMRTYDPLADYETDSFSEGGGRTDYSFSDDGRNNNLNDSDLNEDGSESMDDTDPGHGSLTEEVLIRRRPLKSSQGHSRSTIRKELPLNSEDDNDFPRTHKKTKYEAVREEIVYGNMKKPSPQEVSQFHRALLKLIVSGGGSFDLIQSEAFKKIVELLNSNYSVPDTETLQRLLERDDEA
ncbi:hypothetical protein EC968_000908 [Mortierella alpina]|nr:hypothetical protein EC968_000908 [Mortierella alpina]